MPSPLIFFSMNKDTYRRLLAIVHSHSLVRNGEAFVMLIPRSFSPPSNAMTFPPTAESSWIERTKQNIDKTPLRFFARVFYIYSCFIQY